jgi:hypothetical protein
VVPSLSRRVVAELRLVRWSSRPRSERAVVRSAESVKALASTRAHRPPLPSLRKLSGMALGTATDADRAAPASSNQLRVERKAFAMCGP